MVLKVKYTKLALADIAEVNVHIARDDPAAAKHTIDRIRTAIAGLSLYPEPGRPGRIRGTREPIVPRSPYIVPCRIAADAIEILAVIHGRRAWPTSL